MKPILSTFPVTSVERAWNRKEAEEFLTQSLSDNLVEESYGLQVPIIFKQLRNGEGYSHEEMERAFTLGWCVDLLVASQKENYRHFSQSNNPHQFGSPLLEDAAIKLLRGHLNEAFASRVEAKVLEMRDSADWGFTMQKNLGVVNTWDYGVYQTICHHAVSNINYVLPVMLALYVDGKELKLSRETDCKWLFERIGLLSQIIRDQNNFTDEKIRRAEIREGRLTFPLAYALHLSGKENRKIINDNYGVDNDEAEEKIMQIYDKVKARGLMKHYARDTQAFLIDRLNQLGRVWRLTPSGEQFVFRVVSKSPTDADAVYNK